MFLHGKLLMLIVAHFSVSSAWLGDIDFCSVPSCKPNKHVMCEYSHPGGVSECGIGHKPYPLTKQQKSNLLLWHNKMRIKAALGHYTNGFPLPVSNMHELSWSAELEWYAQRWADQCNTVLAIQNDGCRNTICTNSPVGQNVFSCVFATESDTIDSSLEMLKRQWTEGPLLVPKDTEMSPLSRTALQVTWPASNTLGCAQAHFTNGSHRVALIVCNYGAGLGGAGLGGTPGPKFGAGCSECPDGSACSDIYPGLCSRAARGQGGCLLAALALCAASTRRSH